MLRSFSALELTQCFRALKHSLPAAENVDWLRIDRDILVLHSEGQATKTDVKKLGKNTTFFHIHY